MLEKYYSIGDRTSKGIMQTEEFISSLIRSNKKEMATKIMLICKEAIKINKLGWEWGQHVKIANKLKQSSNSSEEMGKILEEVIEHSYDVFYKNNRLTRKDLNPRIIRIEDTKKEDEKLMTEKFINYPEEEEEGEKEEKIEEGKVESNEEVREEDLISEKELDYSPESSPEKKEEKVTKTEDLIYEKTTKESSSIDKKLKKLKYDVSQFNDQKEKAIFLFEESLKELKILLYELEIPYKEIKKKTLLGKEKWNEKLLEKLFFYKIKINLIIISKI
ncbi:hypothetical protein [Mycoplasma suis]|uniref:Uncharacterized protein n=1 Tax=Mycoplasma suis (strain Illinois) TaxID=768700 RepID=F0QS72_MYCSL|nr:hypothetical protein [Mycoplasma suis]ADX98342.1 hypothetical protein MSU_0821 [Mycoplasma suis str. Illinois]